MHSGDAQVESEIGEAQRRLAASFESEDPAAWVLEYTEDAVFAYGADAPVVGRDALLGLAASMDPLRSMSIDRLRTEVGDGLAACWCRASWVSGPDEGQRVEVTGLQVWRKESDGVWRVTMEHIA